MFRGHFFRGLSSREISVVGTTVSASGATTLTVPAGTRSGDLVCVFYSHSGTGTCTIGTAGYTTAYNEQGSFAHRSVFAYKVQGSTPDTSISLTATGAGCWVVITLRSAGAVGTITESHNAATAPNPPAATLTGPGVILIHVARDENQTPAFTTPPAGYTELANVAVSGAGVYAIGISDLLPAGTYDPDFWIPNSATNNCSHTIPILLGSL